MKKASGDGAKTVGIFSQEQSPRSCRRPRSTGGQSSTSRGTQSDEDRAQLRNLEFQDEGHVKVRPVFPAENLGHLFMRKYGLSREQRSLVISATGGGSKFPDVTQRTAARMGRPADGHRGPRRGGAYEAAVASGSTWEPSFAGAEDEVHEADLETEDSEVQEELVNAVANVRRHFRTYKQSRKRVKEIKKSRQPYMPVVFNSISRITSVSLPRAAIESHWQTSCVEMTQPILCNMAQEVWKPSSRLPHVSIDTPPALSGFLAETRGVRTVSQTSPSS